MPFELKFFVLLTIMSVLQTTTNASNMSLLIALPLHQASGPRTSWERGFEILPGARLAVKDINNESVLLPEHTLKLIVVDSGRDEFEIVRQFVNLTFYGQVNFIGVGGILDPKAISILLPLVKHTGVLLNAITHTDRLGSLSCSAALLPLPSSSAMASVLLNFMKEMKWNDVGLVTDVKNAYFTNVAEKLLKAAKMTDGLTLSPYMASSHSAYVIKDIINSKVKIIIVSLSAEETIKLLCTVHKKGLVWPQYAWIFHSFQTEDLLEQQTESVCDIKDAINGVFLISDQPHLERKLMSGITFSSYYRQYLSSLSETELEHNVTLRPNEYAQLLYNLVWAMAIALNKTSNNCLDMDAEVKAYDWVFRIFHIRNQRHVLIGTMHYGNSSISATSFNASILENAPKGELPVAAEYPSLAYTVILGLQIALMAVFVTLILALYIYFRKEPEIKATSFTLSLLMFAGCYFNLMYLSLLFYANHMLHSLNISRDNAVCLGIQWLSGPGISLPLILATLLVKMLRIYHIFHNTKLHLGCYCSDLALALYVLLILLPDILINLIWVIIDPYQVLFNHQVQGSHIHLKKTCKSRYQKPFFGVLCVYLLVLVIILMAVAIITRKVRMQHFKDTKKVNILSFILGSGIIITFSCWILVQTLDIKRYIAALTVHIPHSVLIIVCLGLLFVPKVFPPLCRHIKTLSAYS